MNETGGLSKYVVATIIFFANIAVWMGIAMYFGLSMGAYIFIIVFGVIMAAVIVWYLSPEEDKEYWK